MIIMNGGWRFQHGDCVVWIYVDDVTDATKVAIKNLPGAPEGEAQRIDEYVFKDFFEIPIGGYVTAKIFRS